MKRTVMASLLAATLLVPAAAVAQGVPGGVERGSREGERAAGPVGVNGVLGIDQRPRFHSYVVERHHPSYAYDGDLRVGADLPGDGVTYYDVPAEYGTHDYRYTVVNNRTVLVDPRTHRVVEIVD
jgi:hypothetical protein